jgi:small subunit ribosomal protein S13
MAVRISGINLDNAKRVEIALTGIYGIGRTTSNQILASAGVSPDTRVKDLTADEENKLRAIIEKDMLVEGDLRREVTMNIKRLKDIGSYRGTRHTKKLPTRGQRTKTNARTKRGKRVTMGSGRKKSSDKT